MKNMEANFTVFEDNNYEYADLNHIQVPAEFGKVVFSNPLLLLKILNKLGSSELLACREVNRVWNIESSKLLLKRTNNNNKLRVEIIHPFSKKYEVSLCQNRNIIKTDTIDTFLTLVKCSNIFPCNVVFVHMKKSNLIPIRNFFNVFGRHIQSLELQLALSKSKSTDIKRIRPNDFIVNFDFVRKILWKMLPNLQRLFLFYPEMLATNSNKNQNQNQNHKKSSLRLRQMRVTAPLPNLKHLGYCTHSPKEFFDDVINAAVNLERISCDTLLRRNLEAIADLGKIHLLKVFSMKLEPSLCRLNLYTKFAESYTKINYLQNFTIDQDGFSRKPELLSIVASIISSILYSSSATLNHIENFPPLGFLKEARIPCLPNLFWIRINCNYNYNDANKDKQIFPPQLNLAKTFPNLKTLILKFSDQLYSLEPCEFFAKQPNPIPSVNALSFDSYTGELSPRWIEYLSQMLPNITEAKFPLFKDFSGVSKYLWNFSCLTKLEFTIGLNFTTTAKSFLQALDAGFTGFAPQSIDQFHHFLPTVSDTGFKNFCDSDDRRLLQKNPSVFNLKNLRKLLIHVGEGRNVHAVNISTPLFRRFVFPLCPQLSMTFLHYHH